MNSRRLLFIGMLLATTVLGRGAASATAPAAKPTAPGQAMIAEVIKTPPEMVDGYLKIGFDRLGGYPFVAPPFDPAADPKVRPAKTGEEQIPAEVKSWSGRKIAVAGFMMPIKMENGLVTEFLLMKDPSLCCFGAVPNVNDWIVVKMKKGVLPLMDLPVMFYGELKVGAVFDNGFLTGIYYLDGDKMGEVQN